MQQYIDHDIISFFPLLYFPIFFFVYILLAIEMPILILLKLLKNDAVSFHSSIWYFSFCQLNECQHYSIIFHKYTLVILLLLLSLFLASVGSMYYFIFYDAAGEWISFGEENRNMENETNEIFHLSIKRTIIISCYHEKISLDQLERE